MRTFNTAGPVVLEDHYAIPPLERFDLDEVLFLVEQKRYFVLHAPRQTGKTSALLALRDLLNSGSVGEYRAAYVNVEAAQAMREDVHEAVRTMLSALASRALHALDDPFVDEHWSDILNRSGAAAAFGETLSRWARADPRPLVLFIDEIDSLVGDTLVSVLRQLRAGYDQRPAGFPQSVVLCGVRDVRDYRIHASSEREVITGGSAFNVKAESLRLGDFTEAETKALLTQHTDETGQAFEGEAVEAVWRETQGQPWLVNALAYETCFRDKAKRDHSRAITARDIMQAREAMIARRETHLDQLADKLQEERVRRVVEPLLVGASEPGYTARDLEYVQDLGLVSRDIPPRIANPIYAEVVPRELAWVAQTSLVQETAWYVAADGGLDVEKLIKAFQMFFREHSEHWRTRFQYQEAWPQLLLQAFLHRVVNGGGRVEREYGLGRGRVDLLLVWPRGATPDAPIERHVVECKVVRRGLETTIAEGTEQAAGYMDRCDADSGHLVVFDRDDGKSWDEKVFRRETTAPDGRSVTVWGM